GAVELDRVHRFGAPWEREASLRLRRGDTDVVDIYDHQGRLHGGTHRQMAMATVSAWWSATEAGETAAMMAPTREAVAVLNDLAQAMCADAGEIDRQSPSVRLGASRAHVGDVVATRRNDRTLRTDRDRMVKNRDRWTIETVLRDGGIAVTGASGRVTLPASYVAAGVELAYAETSHATQGRTVDRSYLYLDGPTDTRGIYVPLTRGRTTNEAFVVLQDERTAAEVVADAVARTWDDQPATALRLDRPVPAKPGAPQAPAPTRSRPSGIPRMEPAERMRSERTAARGAPAETRPVVLSEVELQSLVERAVELQQRRWANQYRLEDCQRDVAGLADSRESCQGDLVEHRARLEQATETLAEHDRPLHRRGHRETIAAAKRNLRQLPAQIAQLEAQLPALDGELRWARTDLGAAMAELTNPDIEQRTTEVQAALDQDATTRGRAAAANPSRLLVHHLGPPPCGGLEAEAWITAAGRIAQHHTLFRVRGGEVLGRRPRAMGQDDYAFTHFAAKQAIEQMDQTLGRPPLGQGRDVPGLSI
ncbi:MAG: AAA family ATPase, partial [Acidimicrobiales bacterium]